MQPHRLIWILCSLWLLLGLLPVWAAQSFSGRIQGRLLFPPSLSAIPPGQEVILHTISSEERIAPRSQPVGTDGLFDFTGLSTDPKYSYLVATQYQGVTYHSERLSLSAENPVINDLVIQVFETTLDDSKLTIQRDHLLIDILPNQLRILEVLILENAGEQTIVPHEGSGGRIAYFPLPTGFQGFQASEEILPNSLEADQKGVAFTRPILPGTTQLVFTYSLPYQENSYTFTKQLPYPTSVVMLLLTDPKITASGPHLQDKGIVTMGERQFHRFDVQGLARNTLLTFTLHNLSSTGSLATPGVSWMVYGATGICVLLGFLYPLLQQRKRRGKTFSGIHGAQRSSIDGQGTPLIPESKDREHFLRQIAFLDDQYDQGLLDPDEYHQKRQELKERLLKMTLQIQRRGVNA